MYQIRRLEYLIDEKWDGKTVKALLQHEGYSATVISGLKKNPKGICIGNKKVTVLRVLHSGDVLKICVRNRPEDEAADRIVPTDIPIDVLYEDDDIIVVNKPSNLPTHPGQNNHEHTLGNALAYYWQQQRQKYIYRPVSRLDKDTTGAIIVSKNAYAAARLGGELIAGQIKKRYIALVSGTLKGKGTVNTPIVRCADSIIKRRVGTKNEENEQTRAVTHYRVLEAGEKCSLVLLELETGRTHQIRVHMASLGHPLCGDWLYGTENELLSRPALHCYDVSFNHPVTKSRMIFTAPVPEDILQYTSSEIKDGKLKEE